MDHPGSFSGIAASVLFGQLGYFLTVSALPLYLRHVGAPAERVGLEIGAGSLASLVMTVIAGPLISGKSPRPFLMSGSVAYIVAAAVMLAFPSEAAITVGRLLQGVGNAVIVPAAYAAVPLLTRQRTGRAMGVMSMVGSLALAVGPAAGLALYSHGGAAWLLFPAMAVGAIGLAVGVALRMPASATDASVGPTRDIVDKPGRWKALLVFDRDWTLPLLATGLNGIYFGAIVAYLPLFLAQIHGPNAGIFFTADAVGVLLLRVPSGMMADRTRPAVPMLLGAVITLGGLAAFAPRMSLPWLILAGVGTGVGAGLFANGVLTEMLALSTSANRGSAMALPSAAIGGGMFLGSAVSGVLFRPVGFGGIVLFCALAEALAVPAIVSMWRHHGRRGG
jgi:MFS family permease